MTSEKLCLLSAIDIMVGIFSVISVGFNEITTDNIGMEGATINVCVEIFDGTLGPGIALDYLIDAPRTDASLPPGSEPDTATGMA